MSKQIDVKTKKKQSTAKQSQEWEVKVKKEIKIKKENHVEWILLKIGTSCAYSVCKDFIWLFSMIMCGQCQWWW